MSQRRKHGFVVRMFLRDCAFLMNFFNRSDSSWVWHGGNYSTATSIMTIAHFLLFALSILFDSVIPKSVHPLTCSRDVLIAEVFGIIISVGIYVEIVTKEFKHDVSAAKQYMTRSDRIKWSLVTFLTLASVAGVVVLLALFGDKYRTIA